MKKLLLKKRLKHKGYRCQWIDPKNRKLRCDQVATYLMVTAEDISCFCEPHTKLFIERYCSKKDRLSVMPVFTNNLL